MFIKPYETPLEIPQLQALKLRTLKLPKNKEIAIDLFKHLAGQNGEREVNYQLQFLPKNKYYIFHNLRLSESKKFFQIDFLILNECFLLILEVKNYRGLIYFNELEQLIHKNESGVEEVYSNPISQVDRHAFQLQNWLYSEGYFNLPIFSYVVFSSSTRLINSQNISKDILERLIFVPNLVKKVFLLSDSYSRPIIKKQEVNFLSKKLLQANVPLQRDILKQYNISPLNLTKGVQCIECDFIPVQRVKGKWICPKCGFTGLNNHLHSLNDYFLLIDDKISNRQAREFLSVDSPYITYDLLKNSGYPMINGPYKGTKYQLEYRRL